MDMGFTAILWFNWILAGFLFGIGWIVASAIYAALLGVLGRGRPPAA